MVFVVIIQTSIPGFEETQKVLTEAGYIKGQHFLLFSNPEEIKDLISDGRKMLITGSFWGNQDRADRFVREAKQQNPLLLAASFSIFDMRREPYDIAINKLEVGFRGILKEIEKFLATT